MKSILDTTEWAYNDVHNLNDDHVEYAKVPMSLMHRCDISAKAKAVFAYMTSKPANYQFASKRIAKHFKEGYRSILSAISELETAGYITKAKLNDGRMLYELKENYWSLTVVEAKECLMEAFQDAFRRPVRQYDIVPIVDAQKAIYEILGSEKLAWDSALDLAEQCRNAEMSINEKTLESWINHIKQ